MVVGVRDVMAQSQKANIAENPVVDGEMYGCLKSFCFVWDTVDEDGGAHLATIPRIRDE